MGKFILPASLTNIASNAFYEAQISDMRIAKEDSAVALMLIDNEIPFTAMETGIKDSNDKYLDREQSNYYSATSSISTSGQVTLIVEYNFKDYAKRNASNFKLSCRIPSSTPLVANSVKVDGVATTYSYLNNIVTVSLLNSSGTVSFAVTPGEAKSLMTYAKIEYRLNGNTQSEVVGLFNMSTSLFTFNVPSESSSLLITVSGITAPENLVTFFIGDTEVGSATSSKSGSYKKSIRIPNAIDGELYKISATAQLGDESKTIFSYLKYNEKAIELEEFTMYFNSNKLDLIAANGTSPMIRWVRETPLTFVIRFKNNDNVKDVRVVSTKDGDIRKINAVWDTEKEAYIACGYFNPDNVWYVPGTISLEYLTEDVNCFETSDVEFKGAYSEDNKYGFIAEVTLNEQDVSFNYAREMEKGVRFTPTSDYYKSTYNDKVCYFSKDVVYIEDVNSCFACQELYVQNADGTFDVTRSGIKVFESEAKKKSLFGRISAQSDNLTDLYKKTKNLMNILTDLPEKNTDDVVYTVVNDYIQDLKNATDSSSSEYWELVEIETVLDMYRLTERSSRAFNQINKYIDHATSVADDPWMLPDFSDEMKDCVNSMHRLADEVNDNILKDVIKKLSEKNGPLWFEKQSVIEKILNKEYNSTDITFSCKWHIDPSGYVYEAVPTNRIEDVTATIYYKDSKTGDAVLWDASEYDQKNPLKTDYMGCYAWDVPEGLWQVKYEKAGYETTYSEWMPVPPPQLDVNVGIVSTATPTVEFINIYQDEAEIKFNQYMDIESITSSNVTFTCGGKTVTGSFEVVDAEKNYDGSKEYATTFSFSPDSNFSGNVTVNISGVKNYADKTMASAHCETKAVVLRVQRLEVLETMNLNYKENGIITLQAAPAAAAAGKKVSITASNSYVAELSTTEVTLDATGKATVNIKTLLPGDVDITYSIEGTTITETTVLSVVLVPVVEVEKITLNVSNQELEVGKTTTLQATITPENATDKSITWSSDKESIATVDKNGKVTAIAEGTAVITASTANGELTANCTITVKAVPAQTYTVSYDANGGSGAPESQTKSKGVALTLTTDVPTRENYSFIGWNTEANGNGSSYAPGAKFTADASVTLYAQWQKIEVTIQSVSVKTNPSKTMYNVGETLNTSGLVITATYSDGSNKEITSGFTCNPTTLNTAGQQTITVTYQGKTTTFVVTVSAPSQGKVKSVSIDNVTMNYKASTTIKPVVEADEGVTYTIKYESSNPKVASVDENGNVKALKKGNATITVTVTDEYGNVVTDTCDVSVKYAFWQWIIIIALFGWIWY